MRANFSSDFAIDVIADVVCPWCWIGKRHLDAAIATLYEQDPDFVATIRWHPFQLNPDLPSDGVDRRWYLEAKFGGPARLDDIHARVLRAGTQSGIVFAFDQIERQPNTLDAHRLVAWAQTQGDVGPLMEALFRAYFTEGRFTGDRTILANIAGDVGLDAGAARAFLDSNAGVQEVELADRRARSLGVDAVPFFVFAEQIGVPGAFPTEALVEAITKAREAALPMTQAA